MADLAVTARYLAVISGSATAPCGESLATQPAPSAVGVIEICMQGMTARYLAVMLDMTASYLTVILDPPSLPEPAGPHQVHTGTIEIITSPCSPPSQSRLGGSGGVASGFQGSSGTGV